MTWSLFQSRRLWNQKSIVITLLVFILTAFYLFKKRKRIQKKSISIASRNILIWSPTQDSTNPNFAFLENTILLLKSLLKCSLNVTLVNLVQSDQEEKQIKDLFLNSGLYSHGLDPRRVLFCDTSEGLGYIVRHINPTLHVDSDQDRIDSLKPFIQGLVYINPKVKDSFETFVKSL